MSDKVLTFGLFELDVRSRQLYRQGRRVRLQEQPLRLLEALLEEPGQVVTRQELQHRLWPSDIYVDFELGLTGAVKRLRQALDDSAENPRFIETVPKIGFRFVAPVRSRLVTDTPLDTAPVPPRVESEPSLPPYRRRGLSAIAATALALTAVAWLLRPEMPALRVTSVRKLTNTGHAWTQENLMSDGARLYYTAFTAERGFQLRQVVLNGNEDSLVEAIPSGSLVRGLSPDHTTFATVARPLVSQGHASPVWFLPVVGGQPRRLGTVMSNDFAWSPDGRAFVFARDSSLVVTDIEHSGERELARVSGRPMCPRWSPDGQLIRFVVADDARNEQAIWEVRADGRHLHALDVPWVGSPMETFGDWAANQRYFVFSSRRGASSDLWALEEESDWWHRRRAAPVQLTSGPIDYYRPLPNATGTQIFAVGLQLSGELLRYDSTRREFVSFLGGQSIDQLNFSRDGQWVAYVTFPEGTLWRARADGREPLQLTTAPVRVLEPHWAPDGRQIVFVGRRPGELPQLFLVSADGGTPTPLLAEPHAETDPSWSASGDFIVFGRGTHGDGSDVALFRFDTRTRRTEQMAGTDGLYAPAISPNGRWIAAQSTGDRAIVIVDVANGERRILVPHAAEYPAWSSDSESLYFNTFPTNNPSIVRVRLADGREEPVAGVPFATRGLFGSWSGLAPDGSPLIVADRSKADVYVVSLTDR